MFEKGLARAHGLETRVKDIPVDNVILLKGASSGSTKSVNKLDRIGPGSKSASSKQTTLLIHFWHCSAPKTVLQITKCLETRNEIT